MGNALEMCKDYCENIHSAVSNDIEIQYQLYVRWGACCNVACRYVMQNSICDSGGLRVH